MHDGVACLQMVLAYHDISVSIQYLQALPQLSGEPPHSLYDLKKALEEKFLFKTLAGKMTYQGLSRAPLPAVLHWKQQYFVVLYRQNLQHAWIADPYLGKRKLDRKSFIKDWTLESNPEAAGVCLLAEYR